MVHSRPVGVKPGITDDHICAKTNAFADNRSVFRLMLLPTNCGSASEDARGNLKNFPLRRRVVTTVRHFNRLTLHEA